VGFEKNPCGGGGGRQAHVAQSVEHLHGKQKVSGSIPLVGSILNERVDVGGPGGRGGNGAPDRLRTRQVDG
jgi:hypothetical protein